MTENNNALRALEHRLSEFEMLLTQLTAKSHEKFIKIERNNKDIKAIADVLSSLKLEFAKQPLSRVRDISAFADNAHKKIRENMDIFLDFKEDVSREFIQVEGRVKDDVRNEVMSHLKLASILASIFFSIIFTLVGIMYYDTKSDLEELKVSANKHNDIK